MTRISVGLAGLVVLMVAVGCSDDDDAGRRRDAAPEPPPGDLQSVGSCRGKLAQQEQAGAAIVEWVPLSVELSTRGATVFTAGSLEDLGSRDIYDGEDGEGIDLPHLVRFGDTNVLSGELQDPMEAYVGQFDAVDAQAELEDGAELLVWIRPQPGGPRFATMAALEADDDVAFLGDCHPGWSPAFNGYAQAVDSDLTAAELLTEIVTHPDGPEAKAFLASPAASTLAGPIKR